jgi:hypothetical protein
MTLLRSVIFPSEGNKIYKKKEKKRGPEKWAPDDRKGLSQTLDHRKFPATSLSSPSNYAQ